MANRFSDTDMWKKAWYRQLSPSLKCVWRFLIDNCDHAGVWDIDHGAFKYFIDPDGTCESLTVEKILSVPALNQRLTLVSDDKIFIPGFIKYQYRIQSLDQLNPSNKVHKSVILRLQSIGILSPLLAPSKPLETINQAPSIGAKEEDKEKELDKEYIKRKIFEIYENHYPLQKGGSLGVDQLLPEMHHENDLNDLKRAILSYSDSLSPKDVGFIKHFNTFISDGWRDWLSPKAGKVILMPKKSTQSIQQKEHLENLEKPIVNKPLSQICEENPEIIQNLNPFFRKKLEQIINNSSSGAVQASRNENDNRDTATEPSEVN